MELEALDQFMDEIDATTDELDYIEAHWTEFATLVWGAGHAADGVGITLLGGNADGSMRHEDSIDGFAAFEVMVALIGYALF
ncbi:MAG TPA: hypothetical protein DEZ27_06410 [Sphaerochaeta sp.]|nr:hypothetical protein [Sphaerochaeta sp.]